MNQAASDHAAPEHAAPAPPPVTQTVIAVAVAVGTLVGIGVSLWILNRAARHAATQDDPDAPLFV